MYPALRSINQIARILVIHGGNDKMEVRMMNSKDKILAIVRNDKELIAMFSGMFGCIAGLIALAATAVIWYL
jgi:hypothetical protein